MTKGKNQPPDACMGIKKASRQMRAWDNRPAARCMHGHSNNEGGNQPPDARMAIVINKISQPPDACMDIEESQPPDASMGMRRVKRRPHNGF